MDQIVCPELCHRTTIHTKATNGDNTIGLTLTVKAIKQRDRGTRQENCAMGLRAFMRLGATVDGRGERSGGSHDIKGTATRCDDRDISKGGSGGASRECGSFRAWYGHTGWDF